MRLISVVTVFSAFTLIAGCDRPNPASVAAPDGPTMALGATRKWVVTTYYWDNGWVRHHAMNAAYLSADLRIGFNAHNWRHAFPSFWAEFDNVYAWGDSDLPQGLVDDFDGETLREVWEGGGGDCVNWGRGAEACLANGVLRAVVEEGSDNGLNHIVGLNTAPVIHGEFDVQLDFSLDPAFHSADPGTTNVALCLWDEHWTNAICIEIDSGFYDTWIGIDQQADTPLGHIVARAFTDHLEGKLRITRTMIHPGKVVESVTGSGSRAVTEQEGDWRTFSFTARRHADGTVDGEWARIRRRSGRADEKSRGIVSCFTIVGDEVWLGGYTTRGLHSEPPRNAVGWRVKDNGEGGGSTPDQISLQYTNRGLGFSAWYCAERPDDPELHDIESGNIRIGR
jgi:hypothetical protein